MLAASAGLLTTVSGHGRIASPIPRLAGAAMEAACGQQVYNNQASDSYGNIQGELQGSCSRFLFFLSQLFLE
jgi:predicted carbohydrate-binding protein with CBM5 and CBM33 domain